MQEREELDRRIRRQDEDMPVSVAEDHDTGAQVCHGLCVTQLGAFRTRYGTYGFLHIPPGSLWTQNHHTYIPDCR